MSPKESLDRALAHDVPLEAVALYARWWQMEGWLRQLAYFVLRSAWGVTWEDQVNRKAAKYRDNDKLTHLSGPDNGDLLAYLDFSLLLKIGCVFLLGTTCHLCRVDCPDIRSV